MPPLSELSPRLVSAPEIHVRLLGHAAFDAAEAMQLFSLMEDSACEVTPSEAFALIDAEPQDPEDAFRSALAVELLGSPPTRAPGGPLDAIAQNAASSPYSSSSSSVSSEGDHTGRRIPEPRKPTA